MALRFGDRVMVIPLNLKIGRIIGTTEILQTTRQVRAGQPVDHSEVVGPILYLVRYEVENATVNRRSELSLYFEIELILVP